MKYKHWWEVVKQEGWPTLTFWPALQVWFEIDKWMSGGGVVSPQKIIIYSLFWIALISTKYYMNRKK